MKYFFLLFAALVAFSAAADAQVTADLTIENQFVSADTFYFDIYITRTNSNDVFLSTADFVLTFNSGNFSSPTVTVGDNTTFNLKASTGADVSNAYSLAFSPTLSGNEIKISMNLINWGSTQANFNANVAKIDNTPTTWKLGTYGVSGLSNIAGTAGLQWKTVGGGNVTKVFSFANTTPWTSTQITANAINPSNAPLPITLASFSCTAPASGNVTLKWTTVSETQNYGFDVQRSSNPKTDFVTIAGSFQPGHGTTSEKHDYSYTDASSAGGTWFYRLRQVDLDKTEHFSDIISINGATGVDAGGSLPTEFALQQNYPNPFNPSTTIEFALPKASHVTIELYNLLGQRVATLLDDLRPAGIQQVRFNAMSLSSGVYMYRMVAADKTFMRKMTLLK